MLSLNSKRMILFCSLVAVALLAVAFYTAPVSAEPNSSRPMQSLPTRPKPPPTKKPSQPDKPASTPVPTAAVPPTPTPTLAATLPPTSTPTPTPSPTPTSITLVDTEFPARAIVPPPSGQASLTFRQLGYGATTLSRDTPDHQYSVDLPNNFQISRTGSRLDLITNHFPRSPDKPTALQIEVNGRLLFSLPLTETNAISNKVHIDLPTGLLRSGSNSIAVHLDTSDTCEEPGAVVDAVIDETSALSFGYQQVSYPADLSFYPLPFAETSLLRVPVTMVLPDRPTARDLAAAMTIAAGLGRKSGGEIDLHAILARDFDPNIHQHHHLIVIGRPDDNAFLDELELPLAIDDTVLEPEQGVLEEIISPWSQFRLVLVVTGLEGKGVTKASHTLNQETNRPGVRGPTAIVTEFRPPAETEAFPTGMALPTTMTLAALGYSDQTAYGAKPQTFGYDFELPRGWHLEDSARFVLRLAHAAILDPADSVLDVRLNDRPIGSTLLDESNANKGELTLSLPERLLETGSNRLEIGLEMNLPGSDKCQALTDERAWTLISSESDLFVPYLVADIAPDLSTFPRPFSQPSGLDGTLFVPPDPPDEATINDLVQLATRLGTPTNTEYFPIQVAYAVTGTLASDSQGAWQDHHVILVGRPTANAMLGELNAYLPQPFVEGSDVPAPLAAGSVAVRSSPNRDLGVVEITYSPWNPEYTLLAVSGTSDEGVHLAVQAILEPVYRLEGNLALVEPAPNPLSGELSQITTYSIEVQPPVAPEETATAAGSEGQKETIVESSTTKRNAYLLAERWW
jgi:hypothetical protein